MDRVLILVDDEPNILAALQRIFRREGYLILTATSGEQGLALLKEHPVAVVISDQRMPQMTGAEFLGHVRERFPETIRIILSGYTELNSVFDAINRGAVYKFLTKPWDDALLRAQVLDAFEQLELRHQNALLMREVQDKNRELEAFNQRLEGEVIRNSGDARLEQSSLIQAHELIDMLPIGVISLSDDGLIIFANRMIHYWLPEAGGLTGQSLTDSLPDVLQDKLQQALGGSARSRSLIALASGNYWLECLLAPQPALQEGLIACLYPHHTESTSCPPQRVFHCN